MVAALCLQLVTEGEQTGRDGTSSLAWDGRWKQGCRLQMLQGDLGRASCVQECVALDIFTCVCLHVCEPVCMCICVCILVNV